MKYLQKYKLFEGISIDLYNDIKDVLYELEDGDVNHLIECFYDYSSNGIGGNWETIDINEIKTMSRIYLIDIFFRVKDIIGKEEIIKDVINRLKIISENHNFYFHLLSRRNILNRRTMHDKLTYNISVDGWRFDKDNREFWRVSSVDEIFDSIKETGLETLTLRLDFE